MDFKDQIKQLGEKIVKMKEQIQTEEATKHSFIMPFIQTLGYDIFNPVEVVPEFICDIGIKKGEKIDYAIFKDGQPVILIECKHWAQKLELHDNQLLRYFTVSKAKFGILTNGINYKFYTDLVAPNKMDEKPFMDIDITDIKDNMVEELKKFHKSYFDVGNIVTTASELKFTYEIKNHIKDEIQNPSEAMVRLLSKHVYPGTFTAKILEQFTTLVKKSFSQVIGDYITNTLKTALNTEEVDKGKKEDVPEQDISSDRKVNTTVEEMEAFFIIKSILRPKVDIKRIFSRDTISYFGVLLDDNNRKPICRLMLDKDKKYMVLFDEEKDRKVLLNTLDDIYQYSDILINTLSKYFKTA
jgi:predicted type IV restriction endonuclease